MQNFCKIFEHTERGQILIVMDTDDCCIPQVSVSAWPPGLGVCTETIKFEDSDAGFANAESLFNEMSLDLATQLTDTMFSLAGDLVCDSE